MNAWFVVTLDLVLPKFSFVENGLGNAFAPGSVHEFWVDFDPSTAMFQRKLPAQDSPSLGRGSGESGASAISIGIAPVERVQRQPQGRLVFRNVLVVIVSLVETVPSADPANNSLVTGARWGWVFGEIASQVLLFLPHLCVIVRTSTRYSSRSSKVMEFHKWKKKMPESRNHPPMDFFESCIIFPQKDLLR